MYIYESYRKIRTGVPLFGPLGSWRHLDMSTRDSLSCCQQVRNKLASYGEACLVYFGHYRISQAVYTYRSPSLQCGYFLDHGLLILFMLLLLLLSLFLSKALSTLSQKSATVAVFSPFSATVAVFCDSLTFLRHCGQGLKPKYSLSRLRGVESVRVSVAGLNFIGWLTGSQYRCGI